ncbi:hypothetical protein J4050_11945 [Winogradskyella sp. DF17]|uniref:Uncharacterized protein n=1 Tax=Winogradskyella pelagia TaxID=2819984 RepID=A0ABS3T3Z3_9FLAO|nr:hypothetical protein [Winogradskyella sp. DF17]MBO3117465.1 hypothetical protein [Winogradskyella sp. DF17]
MKNFLSLIVGIIVGGALMYYFGSKDDIKEMAQEIRPNGLISPAEAKVLDQAYTIKHNIINDSLFKKSTNGGDNRSSWFALEDVEGYIQFAKKEAGTLGYTLDGLRVYLGSYPNSKGETGLTTVFFIPTGKQNVSDGSMFTLPQGGGSDIPGGSGLNRGSSGQPPSNNYPQ